MKPSGDGSVLSCEMPAYQLVCLNDRGVMIHMMAVECDNDCDAVRLGIEMLADDCASIEVTTMLSERIIWCGTREGAKSFAESAGER